MESRSIKSGGSYLSAAANNTSSPHFAGLTPEQIDSLKLRFSDLTDAEIALLQRPATDAARAATDAAGNANIKASKADIAAISANQAASDAATKAAAADSAARGARTAADNAQAAADRLGALSDHPAEIRDGYWWLWNEAAGEYENSGQRTDGNTLFASFDIDLSTGELAVTTPDGYDGARFAIDSDGNLTVEV